MRWEKGTDAPPVVHFKERTLKLTEIGAPLALLARGAQPPPLQLMFFGAAPLHNGELADPQPAACYASRSVHPSN
jgi:hypothetical protein